MRRPDNREHWEAEIRDLSWPALFARIARALFLAAYTAKARRTFLNAARFSAERDAQREAERLDRIRNPRRYQGK